jgi:phage FluMu gp28-like protein
VISKLLPTLTKEQLLWIKKLLSSKKIIAIKSRRAGITYCSGIGSMLAAEYGEDSNIVATNLRTAKEYLRVWRYKAPQHGFDTTATTFVQQSTGARVQALPNYPEVVRGFGGNMVIDEAGFIPDLEEVLIAAHPLTIRGGRIALISSPSHTDHYLYKLTQDPDWEVINFPFDEVAIGIYLTIFQTWDLSDFKSWFSIQVSEVSNPETELFCQWVSASDSAYFTKYETTDKFTYLVDAFTISVSNSGWQVGLDVAFFRHPTTIAAFNPNSNEWILLEFWGKSWEYIYSVIRPLLDKSSWIAIDKTGVGGIAAQQLQKDYTKSVGVTITTNWYSTSFEQYRMKLEDSVVKLPNVKAVIQDHKEVRRLFQADGKVQAFLREYKFSDIPLKIRHCDWAIAFALATQKTKRELKKFDPWALG